MGRIRLDGASSCGRAARVLGVLATGGLAVVLTPVIPANASSFTWAGGSPGRSESAAHWSAGANWEGNIAPGASQVLQTLTFPHLTNSECTSKPPTDTCYLTLNNISGLTAESMQLDDADNYLLAGEGITLGSGGLTAAPASGASGFAGSFMEMPLQLSASQRWSIANRSGGAIEENGLLLSGGLTGAGSALTVELSNGPALILENSTEVGPVTIEGPNATGQHIANGSVLLENGELNSSDRETVDLSHIFFSGTGAVGALKTNGATVVVGSGTEPVRGLQASSVKLDSGSGVLFEIMGSGVTARTDYSQLASEGPIELAGAIVVVVGKPSEKASCPVLVPGATYTFLSTTGTLSGSFANAPEGGPEVPIGFSKSCSHSSQTMRISYNRSGNTETVTGTVEARAEERQKEEAKERETKEKDATTKLIEEHAKKVGEEAAAVEAAAKKREEAAAAETAAAKKREEEAAATITTKHQEEEAPITGSVSLAGPTISAQSSGQALVKLTCRGSGACSGKLTLMTKSTPKRGKKTRGKTETIGVASFSIPPGKTATIKIQLNASGRGLLSTGHGRLSANLIVLKSSPAPSQTHTENVQLVQQKARGKRKK
jgi:hypothetical protein